MIDLLLKTGGIGHSVGDLLCSVSQPLGGKLSRDDSERAGVQYARTAVPSDTIFHQFC